jgi:lysozyme
MKIKTISDKGISLLHHFEGLKLKPYLCPAGVPTIAFGNTYYEDGSKVTLKDPAITVKKAYALFQNVAPVYHGTIAKSITADITQNQYDALFSLCYNLGHIPKSLANKINANQLDKTIWGTFLLFGKAVLDKDGKDNDGDGIIDEKGELGELLGLIRRRNSEAHLYFLNELNFYTHLK